MEGKNGTPSSTEILLHIRRGVYFIGILGTLAILGWAQAFFVPLAFAALLTLCLNPLVGRLRRIGVPRVLGAAVVLGAVVALSIAGALSLGDDFRDLLEQMPASARHLRRMLVAAASNRSGWWHHLTLIAHNAGATPALAAGLTQSIPVPVIRDGVVEATLWHGSVNAFAALGQIGIVLFLVYFMLVVKLPVSGRTKHVTRDILREIGKQVQRYVGVLVLANLLLGVLTWLAFSLLKVSYAAAWGVAAGVLHFIPYAGPAAIAAASAVAAGVQFESLGTGLLVALVSLGLSAMIGIVFTTWLTGKASRMNTATVFIGLLFWGWLWGLPGLLLGAPIMMALKVTADRIPSLAWLTPALNAGVTSIEPPAVH